MSAIGNLKPVLPNKGQIIIEDLQELVLCKPRLMPLKSFTLEKLEKMQENARKAQEKPETPKAE